jgi:mannose-6-phosphate isomerase-like protein (cupin superfamily)
MDPVSVAANAENRSKTLAYQTVSGYTTKVTIIDTQRPNPDNVQAITAMKRFRQKWIAVNPLYTIVFGMTKHQTIEQSK